MSITSHEFPLAWNQEGTACLLSFQHYGPEGGSEQGCRLVYASGEEQDWIFSNDMNPGNGSRPQQVTDIQYQRALESLRTALATEGFAGVNVASGGKRLKVPLAASDEETAKVKSGEFQETDEGLVQGDLWLAKTGNFRFSYQKTILASLRFLRSPEGAQWRAWISPSGKVLLIFLCQDNSQELRSIWRHPSADSLDWKMSLPTIGSEVI
jgi:hypothetical protein